MLEFYSCGTALIIILLTFPGIRALNSQLETHTPNTPTWERIVTDLSIIDSYDAVGVPIDYSYNETRVNFYSDEEDRPIISAPGCPKSIDGVPWVQYGNPPRCYLAGYKGPCWFGEELLLETPESNKAICACSSLKDENMEMLEKSDDGKFLFSSSPYFIYGREDKKCYNLKTQGPCETGFVLIRLANSSTIKCLPDFTGLCGYNFETQTCEKLPPPFEGGGDGGMGGGVFGGSAGQVLPNDCGKGEMFSSTLKRCLKTGRGRGFVLG